MRQPVRTSAILAASLVALLAFSQPVRSATLTILRLPLTILNGALRVVRVLPQLPSVLDRHEQLRAELLQNQLEIAQLREQVRSEREAQLLGAVSPPGVMAAVIGRSMLPTQQTVLLGRGRDHGVVRDTAVIDAAGVVGRVTGASAATAVVTLLTDADSRVAAMVERSRETGLLVGRSRGVCELIYLELDADVQEGDRIITAGLGEAFPKGLLLGTVTSVVRHEALGASSAWVKPAVRLGRLEEVWCLTAKRAEPPTKPPARPAPAPAAPRQKRP